MATKKRRARRRTRTTVTTVSASPRRRRRRALSTSPRRRKRRKGGLGEMVLVKGKYAKYANPLLKGGIGGGADMVLRKLTPAKFFTEHPTMAPYEKWIKGGLLVAGALVAAHMDEPLVAAGMAGGAAVLVMQEEGILQEEGMNDGRLLSSRFVRDGNLLSGRGMMSNRRLLSEGGRSPYPGLYPQGLYESPDEEINY